MNSTQLEIANDIVNVCAESGWAIDLQYVETYFGDNYDVTVGFTSFISAAEENMDNDEWKFDNLQRLEGLLIDIENTLY